MTVDHAASATQSGEKPAQSANTFSAVRAVATATAWGSSQNHPNTTQPKSSNVDPPGGQERLRPLEPRPLLHVTFVPDKEWHALTTTTQEARARAEAKFKKMENDLRQGAEARAEYNERLVAMREKTARLKALRLARDASNAEPDRRRRALPERTR